MRKLIKMNLAKNFENSTLYNNINTNDQVYVLDNLISMVSTKMEIVFGMPSKDCKHVGICKINRVEDINEDLTNSYRRCANEQKAIALIQQKESGKLVFRFPIQQLDQEIITTQFANQQFTILGEYHFPKFLQQLFFPRICLEVGIYPVEKIANYLVVEL